MYSSVYNSQKKKLQPQCSHTHVLEYCSKMANLISIFSMGLVSITQHGVSDPSRSSGGFLITAFSPSTLGNFLLLSIWDPPCLNFRANTFVLSSFSTLNLIEPEVPPRKAAFIVKHGNFDVDNLRSRKWVGFSFSFEFCDAPLKFDIYKNCTSTINSKM